MRAKPREDPHPGPPTGKGSCCFAVWDTLSPATDGFQVKRDRWILARQGVVVERAAFERKELRLTQIGH